MANVWMVLRLDSGKFGLSKLRFKNAQHNYYNIITNILGFGK